MTIIAAFDHVANPVGQVAQTMVCLEPLESRHTCDEVTLAASLRWERCGVYIVNPQIGNGRVKLQLPWRAPPVTHPPVLSRGRVSTGAELGLLIHETLRLAWLIVDIGPTVS